MSCWSSPGSRRRSVTVPPSWSFLPFLRCAMSSLSISCHTFSVSCASRLVGPNLSERSSSAYDANSELPRMRICQSSPSGLSETKSNIRPLVSPRSTLPPRRPPPAYSPPTWHATSATTTSQRMPRWYHRRHEGAAELRARGRGARRDRDRLRARPRSAQVLPAQAGGAAAPAHTAEPRRADVAHQQGQLPRAARRGDEGRGDDEVERSGGGRRRDEAVVRRGVRDGEHALEGGDEAREDRRRARDRRGRARHLRRRAARRAPPPPPRAPRPPPPAALGPAPPP